jgi:hypothetical protein
VPPVSSLNVKRDKEEVQAEKGGPRVQWDILRLVPSKEKVMTFTQH